MHGNAENSGEEDYVSNSDSDLKMSEEGGNSLDEPLTAEEERKGFSEVDKGKAVIQIPDDDNVFDSSPREEDIRSLGTRELILEVQSRLKAIREKQRAFHVVENSVGSSHEPKKMSEEGGISLCEPLTGEEERKGFCEVDKGNAVIQIPDRHNASGSPPREEDRRSLGIFEMLEEIWSRIKPRIEKERVFDVIENSVGSSHEPMKKRGSKRKRTLLMWEVYNLFYKLWVSAYEITNADSDVVNEERDEIAEPPPDLLIPLLRYQKEWLAWALKQEESESRGGILGDEMGMGKTIQAIALVLAKRVIHQSICGSDEPSHSPSSSAALPETKCTLVISPVVAMKQWESEIYKFTPKGSTRVLVYHGSKRKKNSDAFKECDFVLTTYNTVMAEYARGISACHAVKWERVILDEAHYIKGKGQKVAKAVFALESSYRWALSGTVLQSHVGGIFAMVRFLRISPYSYFFCQRCACKSLEFRNCSCGHLFGHFSWWERNISKPIRALGDNANQNRKRRRAMILLKQIVLNSIALRCTKKGRAADISIPQKTVYLRRDSFDKEEEEYYKSLYDESRSQFSIYAENGTILNNFMHIFQLLTRLQQAADHPYLVVYSQTAALKSGSTAHPDNGEQVCDICLEAAEEPVVTPCQHVFCKECLINYLADIREADSCPSCINKLTADFKSDLRPRTTKCSSILDRIHLTDFHTSTKIEALREEIYCMIQRDGSAKAVVFSHFTSFLELISYSLEKSGINCVQLVGTMNLTARESAINRFNEDSSCKIFLVSIKAGGVALNLTIASHVFLMEPWWNPTVEWQAIDRIHRIGQYKPVRVTRFIVENTIEERILNLQEKQKLVFEWTVGDSPEAPGRFTAEDLKFLFH